MQLKILLCVIVGFVTMLSIHGNNQRELIRQAVQKQMEQKTCN